MPTNNNPLPIVYLSTSDDLVAYLASLDNNLTLSEGVIKQDYVPVNLVHENLMTYLLTLQKGLETESLVRSSGDVKVDNVKVAVSEFIDLLSFTASQANKNYILKRILKLKSVERLLQEIPKYLPIDFNFDIDPEDNLPKTYYKPKLLKVAIKSLTVNNLASDFISIIDNTFNQLLYFLEYKLSIEEIIYNLEVLLEPLVVTTDEVPVKKWKLDIGNIYKNTYGIWRSGGLTNLDYFKIRVDPYTDSEDFPYNSDDLNTI